MQKFGAVPIENRGMSSPHSTVDISLLCFSNDSGCGSNDCGCGSNGRFGGVKMPDAFRPSISLKSYKNRPAEFAFGCSSNGGVGTSNTFVLPKNRPKSSISPGNVTRKPFLSVMTCSTH